MFTKKTNGYLKDVSSTSLFLVLLYYCKVWRDREQRQRTYLKETFHINWDCRLTTDQVPPTFKFLCLYSCIICLSIDNQAC